MKKFVDGIFKLLILTKEGKESSSNKHVSLLIRCIFRPSKCIKKNLLRIQMPKIHVVLTKIYQAKKEFRSTYESS